MNSLKENAIKEYLSKIDWKREWSYQAIEEDMRRFLGERPTLDITYKKDVMVNEMTAETKEITKLSKISVIYTDTDEKIKSLSILFE